MSECEKRITAIKTTKRNAIERKVFVDGKCVAALPLDVVVELDLMEGQACSDEMVDRICKAAGYAKAKREALKMLNRRALSCGELTERLKKKGYDGNAVEFVVAELNETGYLNDEAYGRVVIEQERRRKAAGRRLLQQKLYQKKLKRDVIDRLLDEADEERDVVNDALELARKRFETATMQGLEERAQKRRLWSLLQRRGFDYQTIEKVVARLYEERESE